MQTHVKYNVKRRGHASSRCFQWSDPSAFRAGGCTDLSQLWLVSAAPLGGGFESPRPPAAHSCRYEVCQVEGCEKKKSSGNTLFPRCVCPGELTDTHSCGEDEAQLRGES